MEQKIAVGLDIGTTKITVMIGRKTEHGKIEILGMGKGIGRCASIGIVVGVGTGAAIRVSL